MKWKIFYAFGTFAIATWIWVDWKLPNKKIWLQPFLKLSFPFRFMKNMLLKNNIVFNSLKKSHREQKNVLELVHFDICGSIKPSSNGGKKIIITFIDDYTKKNIGVFFTGKIQKLLAYLKVSRHVLRMK